MFGVVGLMDGEKQTEVTYTLLWDELRKRIASEAEASNYEWYTQHAFTQVGNLMDRLEERVTPLQLAAGEMARAASIVYAVMEAKYSWKLRYRLIFRPEVSRVLFDALGTEDYYDPDTSYQEDVLAFVRWLDNEGGRQLAGLVEIDGETP